MSTKLIPAPIDNKNVTQDWIEEIFDDGNCTWSGNKCVGFVKGSICGCVFSGNIVAWKIIDEFTWYAQPSFDELERRLREHDADGLVVEYFKSRDCEYQLTQRLYFKDE